jgi:hypothetical protein
MIVVKYKIIYYVQLNIILFKMSTLFEIDCILSLLILLQPFLVFSFVTKQMFLIFLFYILRIFVINSMSYFV